MMRFLRQSIAGLAGGGYRVYLAASRVNLQLTEERWPDIRLSATQGCRIQHTQPTAPQDSRIFEKVRAK